MLTQSLLDAINEQINMELRSAYAYLGMSAYCERTHFGGCGSWLRAQSQEEVEHAMKLFDFLSDCNEKIALKALPEMTVDFASIPEVFEQALKHEMAVTAKINALYELALREKAHAAATMLEWFVKEQVEEEKSTRDISSKLNMVKNDPAALLDMDRQLGARTPEKD